MAAPLNRSGSITKVPDRDHIRHPIGELDDSEFPSRQRAAAWTDYLYVAAQVEPEVVSSLLSDEVF
jgi:hypothetical protein